MSNPTIIGDTTFWMGDCLDLMTDIPEKSVDMILCDLPYGTTACSWDTIIPFEPLWKQYKRIIKDHGAIVLTASQPFATDLINSNRGWFKYEWIWDKNKGANFCNANKQPMRSHENILIFSNGTNKYYPIKEFRGKKRIKGGGRTSDNFKATPKTSYNNEYYPKTVLNFSNCNNSKKDHPTQKPVALFKYLIKTYTNEGETVQDNCFGSGTTAIACYNTGRKFIGIEKEKKYFDIAVERFRRETAQLRIGDLKT